MTLQEMGFKPTGADACVYTDTAKQVFILIYVDDILIAYHDLFQAKYVKNKVSQEFTIKDLGLDLDQRPDFA